MDLKLGQIISGEQHRDAIHIAVAPVMAGHTLKPGEHVGFMANGRTGVVAETIGIVDPFLKDEVELGERFWLFLYPNTVTSLRHEWSHPSFALEPILERPSSEIKKSIDWISNFAIDLGVPENELMVMASLSDDGSICFGNETNYAGSEDVQEFWKHFQIVTGKKVAVQPDSTFRCAC